MFMKKSKVSNRFIVFIGLLIVFLGFCIVFRDYLKSKKDDVYEKMYFTLTDQPTYTESGTVEDEEVLNDVEVNDSGEEVFIDKDYYVGRIEIPKIGLVKGFCDVNSKWNDVSKNVAVMQNSRYPDIDRGNLILVAHAGSAWNSFFGKLYQLNKSDLAYVYYKNYKYTYKLVNVYDVDKTGYVKIYRDKSKTTLTLITCTQNNMKKQQTVYIMELIGKESV